MRSGAGGALSGRARVLWGSGSPHVAFPVVLACPVRLIRRPRSRAPRPLSCWSKFEEKSSLARIRARLECNALSSRQIENKFGRSQRSAYICTRKTSILYHENQSNSRNDSADSRRPREGEKSRHKTQRPVVGHTPQSNRLCDRSHSWWYGHNVMRLNGRPNVVSGTLVYGWCAHSVQLPQKTYLLITQNFRTSWQKFSDFKVF